LKYQAKYFSQLPELGSKDDLYSFFVFLKSISDNYLISAYKLLTGFYFHVYYLLWAKKPSREKGS